jgi:hypothetical protein
MLNRNIMRVNMKKQEKNIVIRNSIAEFLIFAYQTKQQGINVLVKNGTIWLSQKNMGLLFETTADNVGLHIKNIFKDRKLQEESVAEIFSVTATDGKKYNVKHYNLDIIIAVGYKVNSQKAIEFRRWATNILNL